MTQDKKDTKKDKKAKEEVEELSPEDAELKSQLEMLVTTLAEPKVELYPAALESLVTLIKSSTSSMTSVPKPLKFLAPHYKTLVDIYTAWQDSPTKKFLSDILSVLAMSYAEPDSRDSLKYRLAGTLEDAGSWGHEYVRYLASQLIAEHNYLSEKEEPADHVLNQALSIVPFFLSHNAEADACDLLLELEALDKLPQYVDVNSYARVCLYIISCVPYVTAPDDKIILKTAHQIYRDQNQFSFALLVAMKLNDPELIKLDIDECEDPTTKKQLGLMLARLQIPYETEDSELADLLNNTNLSKYFLSLARDLDILAPKTPEDVYKSHLENHGRSIPTASVDSAKQNLASTFVNAFVNAGFGSDKLLLGTEEGSWIYKNKDHGMMSAAASLGAILLWDVEVGLTQIDKYLYSNEDYIKAGALLSIGLVTSNVRNESDPALALLSEQVNASNATVRAAAITGLGIAYAGSGREEVLDLLLPLVVDTGLTMELSSLAALSLGLVFVGTCHGDITSSVLQTLMEREDAQLKDPYAKLMIAGFSLLFLGKQEACDAPLETLKAIEHPIAKVAIVMLESVAYGGTGNVLKVQKMLHFCNDHLESEKEDDTFQAFAVLGIALIAMGEDIGSEMALRSFNHLMHYGEPVIRRAIPLAIGLLYASNPVVTLLDLLSRYSHDNDQEVSMNAIFAMGLVGAGSNHARLAQMLRGLAVYYSKEPNHLFMVRIAQGLLHMGKGTLSLSPFSMDRSILSPVGISGLFVVLTALLDAKTFIFGKAHYLLYFLIPSMYPRFLITLDESLNSLPVTVRVGQAVDTVGQAGRPKTITGFQTHSTPVLLAFGERAELATQEYLASGHILEGIAILKKNPEWEEDTEMAGK